MKNIVMVAVALTLMASTANADLWTAWKNSGLEAVEPDVGYRVETPGLDVRVYEWTPVTAPNMTCIMAWGQTHPAGLQCFPKVAVEADAE